MIIITSDIVLSSNVLLKGIENFTIVGQGNPTVNCNGNGSAKFISCNNVTVKDIYWKQCGSNNESIVPGIEFYNSSNIEIQNCSFHHPIGQAVVLSKTSGNVPINNCQFAKNNHYESHCSVLYFSKGDENNSWLRLIIHNCSFSYNSVAKSLVYFGSSVNKLSDYLSIQTSVFRHNHVVPVYISHTTLYLKSNVVFEHNIATDGGGILSSSSLVIIENNSNISFYNNSATMNGGGIFLNDSEM